MGLIVRGHITDGMIKNGIENNRGMSCEMQNDADVNIRDLEARLREAGCSRSQAKELISRYKIVADMTDSELRDAGLLDPVYNTQREAVDCNDDFDSLMDEADKLKLH